MRVLHITNWYPDPLNPSNALWVEKHIRALDPHCENTVFHLQVVPSKSLSYTKKASERFSLFILNVPTNRWRIIEWLTGIVLVFYLVKLKPKKNFDIINIHIAYPLLTYWHVIKEWIKTPLIITEHWSAYHFNFGVKKELPRIQRIFRQNIPVISVSEALANDIKKFSKAWFPSFVVPNVVDEKIFYADSLLETGNFFFMVGHWKKPKDPFPAMAAFLRFNNETGNRYSLKIGGYGDLSEAMKAWILENDENQSIQFFGKMEPADIANHMRTCQAFLHPSDYETFSVVCAEAVCCGAIVIAPRVGGIPEVVGENGILMDTWEEADWYKVLFEFSEGVKKPTVRIDTERFSSASIGMAYFEVLKKIVL